MYFNSSSTLLSNSLAGNTLVTRFLSKASCAVSFWFRRRNLFAYREEACSWGAWGWRLALGEGEMFNRLDER